MNTKTFAQQSRNLLIDGVAQKLLFWGFDAKGNVLDQPQKISGGYLLRGMPYDDPNVPKLWEALKSAISRKGIEVVVEEAAYTWFNRMMAMKILAKNGYDESQLDYVEGMEHTPQLLQRARQGQYAYLNEKEQERLRKVIGDYSKDQEAFALLLVSYCHSNQTLNTVFGKLDDYTELLLPDNMLQDGGFLHLLNTTDAISDEDYKKVELIGWLYQFYISERKDEVFKSFKKNKKAEAKDIPAATQIFTPNWIVKYMVENTAGRIWLGLHPKSPLKGEMKYYVENEADGKAEPIIKEVSELTLIDPAAGSGHILVEGFDLLYQMYMEQYYTPEEAVESILKNNLFGLDIDDRAAQLATFAILLKAASRYRDVFAKGWLPNVNAMPEAREFSLQEVKDFLGSKGTAYVEQLNDALRLMKQAKNLGSVMKLKLDDKARSFIETRFAELGKGNRDFNEEAVYQDIKPYVPVLLLLTKKYSSVVANPPYMGKRNMNSNLREYLFSFYPNSKMDLMTVFMEKSIELSDEMGLTGMINLPSWMFLSSFEELRKSIIETCTLVSLIENGRGIFGSDFGSVAFILMNKSVPNYKGVYKKLFDQNEKGRVESITKKSSNFFDPNFPSFSFNQTNYLKIPGSPIAFWASDKVVAIFGNKKLADYSTLFQGIITGSNETFVKNWAEVSKTTLALHQNSVDEIDLENNYWIPYNKGGESRRWYGNQDYVVNFSNSGKDFTRGRHQFSEFFLQPCFSWTYLSISSLAARYFPHGFLWDVHGSSLFPNNPSHLNYFLALISSAVGWRLLNILNPTISFQVENIASVPVILGTDKQIELVNQISNNAVELTRKDWNTNETSWDFEKSPLLNKKRDIEQAYQDWQVKASQDFFQLHNSEEELNRVFINIYGLQDEVPFEVPLKDITILQEELDRNALEALEPAFRKKGKEAFELPIKRAEVISQFISYAIGLFMGRYRLNKTGLNIAHPNPSEEEMASYTYNGGKVIIDEDAILPLMGSNANFKDDALYQFNALLDTIWGQETRTENINFIENCLNKDLEKFLIKDFYKYHCDMYKKKPIYWLFSSEKGAFQVLVYMHRMNEFTVEKIRANYLLEHLKKLRSEENMLKGNESSLSTQQAKRLDQVRKDLVECEAYDLELKNVADEQIKIDLDEGVTANYELFKTVVAKIK